MNNISYFFKILKKSDISLIGYFYRDIKIKDEIISKIPHVKLSEINSSFSFKKYFRDEKLKSIFDDEKLKSRWFVLDINEILASSNDLITRQLQIKDVILSISDTIANSKFQLIILSPMYRPTSDFDINNFNCGRTPIHISDFVSIIDKDHLEIIKNRFDYTDSKISLENLKDYTYICDDEDCK